MNIRCAIYTRKSTDEGLAQEFNSLDAQRDAAEKYIASQREQGWTVLPQRYDDGGFTGGNVDRPGLQQLMNDIEAGHVDCVVVYKVDRLSRSLLDFARLMETFERHRISFVSVTQQFNTTHSMGRLTLNILLSFAQFERELISERTRDKIAAARRRGKWVSGIPPLGYDVVRSSAGSTLAVNEEEAARVREIFGLYLQHGSLIATVRALRERGWVTKVWTTRKGDQRGGHRFDKAKLYSLLTNVVYAGKIRYKDEVHEGEHEPIVSPGTWRRVQATLRHNGRSGGKDVRNRTGALLRRRLHCTACDRAMSHSFTTKKNRQYRYYVCMKAQREGWDTCPTRSVPAEAIEQFVVDQIRAVGRDREFIGRTVAEAQRRAEEALQQLNAEQAMLTRQLARDEAELQNLAGISGDEVAARLADLQDRIATAERRLGEIAVERDQLEQNQMDEAEVTRALADFDGLWHTLSIRERCRLIEQIVERVDYDGRDGTVTVTFHDAGIQSLANHHEEGAAA